MPSHTFVFWLDSYIYYFELQENDFYLCSNISGHTETTIYSIKCNQTYLELRNEGYPLILSFMCRVFCYLNASDLTPMQTLVLALLLQEYATLLQHVIKHYISLSLVFIDTDINIKHISK